MRSKLKPILVRWKPRGDQPHGLTVLREARARGDRTPVLVLTARDRTEERIAGLDAGADGISGGAAGSAGGAGWPLRHAS